MAQRFAIGINRVLQTLHGVIRGTSATQDTALVRGNVYIEGYPGFDRMARSTTTTCRTRWTHPVRPLSL